MGSSIFTSQTHRSRYRLSAHRAIELVEVTVALVEYALDFHRNELDF